MTAEQTFKVTELLRRNIKIEKDAESIVTQIENIVDNKFEAKSEIFASKEDLYKVKDDLHKDIRQIMWALIVLILPLYALIIFQIIKTAHG